MKIGTTKVAKASVLLPSRGGALLIAAAALGLSAPAQAQLGLGWLPTTYTKRIHLDDEAGLQTFTWSPSRSVCSPTSCADYSYDSATDTETFRIFDSRSNRSEIRLVNEYSTGIRQFEGYVTFYDPLEDESLFQIFGSTSGATLCMMRGYSSNGGKLRVVGGIGDIQYNTYGIERRINVIHDQNNYVQFYVDGVLKGQFSENEQVDNYWKYGVYGTTNGNVPAIAKWRAVRTFRDGLPPGVSNTPPGAYEAENAYFNGPVIASNQTGYTGTGFLDYVNDSGDFVSWTVDADAPALYDLKFRYALQSGDRPLEIQLNGEVVNPSLSFPATGAWNTWAYATLPRQLLKAGTNTIRATAAGSSGPNVDYLQLSLLATGHALFGDFNQNNIVDVGDYVVWRNSIGLVGTNLPADGTGRDGLPDGNVDQLDYNLWRANFGKSLTSGIRGSGAGAAVPEPSSQFILAVGMMYVSMLLGRKRN
ncbi:MAG: CBM35 domain-containing protein [Pirellulales bacterium]